MADLAPLTKKVSAITDPQKAFAQFLVNLAELMVAAKNNSMTIQALANQLTTDSTGLWAAIQAGVKPVAPPAKPSEKAPEKPPVK